MDLDGLKIVIYIIYEVYVKEVVIMLKKVVVIIILPFSVLFAQVARYRTEQISDPRTYAGFDSLNTRFIGNWPFGVTYAVSFDPSRNLVFCGSGGGVYVLEFRTQ